MCSISTYIICFLYSRGRPRMCNSSPEARCASRVCDNYFTYVKLNVNVARGNHSPIRPYIRIQIAGPAHAARVRRKPGPDERPGPAGRPALAHTSRNHACMYMHSRGTSPFRPRWSHHHCRYEATCTYTDNIADQRHVE
jgi:hypothetical protein